MHVDPDLLALLALGEHAGTESDRRHMQNCVECADELSQLRRVATLGRSVNAETVLSVPDRRVWVRVSDQIARNRSVEPLDGARPTGDAPVVQPEAEVIAYAQLSPVGPSWSHASGKAELATDARGRRLLELTLRADLPTTGVRQAWLVHQNDPHLRQTLGILDGPFGLWTVERSIDLDSYTILDISQQDTGETNYSGQTIVQGALILVD